MVSRIALTPARKKKNRGKDEKGDGENLCFKEKWNCKPLFEQVSSLVDSHVLQRDIVLVTNHRVELRTNWQRRALQENRCVSARTGRAQELASSK